jgi:hypothetical protein
VFIEVKMIYPNELIQDGTRCLRNTLGSCGGCNIAMIAMGLVRWNGLSIKDAESQIKKSYCPTGIDPDISIMVNREASYGMGQTRTENLEGLESIPRQGWLFRRS